jgi:tetratricopeptide (TPR) repeat protein/REP element-mobilizing transposase RayT
LARLACRRGDHGEALALLDESLARNARHEKARELQDLLANPVDRASARSEPAGSGERAKVRFTNAYRELERGLDYLHAGLFDQAKVLFESASDKEFMATYYVGWLETLRGDDEAANAAFVKAAEQPFDFAFPNQLECVPALETALARRPEDALALYALGNFWYAHRQYDDAIACWERCTACDPGFPTAWRNLGLAYMNKKSDGDRAQQALEMAWTANGDDARVLFELDQLYKKRNREPASRLDFLADRLDLVLDRDDLTIEYVTLLNLVDRPQEALDLLLDRAFHPWEGGEGKATGQYVVSLLKLAGRAIAEEQHDEAVALLERALSYPENLGEGKLEGVQDNHVHYALGCAHEGRGETEAAHRHFKRAAKGLSEPTSAMYYNDQPPDMVYYQGLARRKLGRTEEAEAVFHKLIAYGEEHLDDDIKMDYFAVSLPDFLVFEADLNQRHRVHCHYMMALGEAGLGNHEKAKSHFEQVLAWDASHQGAHRHLGGGVPSRRANMSRSGLRAARLQDENREVRESFHPGHLAHLRSFQTSPLVFFTVCTHDRQRFLAQDVCHEILRSLWASSAERNGWYVGRYVLMPDHVHLFARPSPDADPMKDWVKLWKSVSARSIKRSLELTGPVWQADYFDRYLRSSDRYAAKWEYVRNNPVRAGLVDDAAGWAFQGVIHELGF